MIKKLLFLIFSGLLVSCGGTGDNTSNTPPVVNNPLEIIPIHDTVPNVDYINANDIILYVGFENNQVGTYTEELFDADFDNHWQRIDGIAAIIDNNDNKKLAITSPANKYKKGLWAGKDLAEYNELYLSFKVNFDKEYDFSLGGKLPGLGALNTNLRDADNNQLTPTGCKVITKDPDAGFSLRSMFKENGKAIGYFYYQNNPSTDNCGEQVPYMYNGTSFAFKREKTYLIEQYVKMNDAGLANGIVTIHVNGFKVLEKTGLMFSENRLYKINQLFINIWHGGNSIDWAPSVNSTVVLDDVALSSVALSY